MGQERGYGSAQPGNDANARRVFEGTGNSVKATELQYAPPLFGEAPNTKGYNISRMMQVALLAELAGTAQTANIDVYAWSHISEKWHLWKTFNISSDFDNAFPIGVSMWDGIQVVVRNNTNQLNVWLITEVHFETIGATSPNV